MSSVTAQTTKAPPTTTSQEVSKFLWKTAGYALEGAAITGLVVLTPHLIKNCLDPEQATNFLLPVADIHNAFAWTATAALVWPIGRHAYAAGTSINKELSGLPKKIGTYAYSLFPTKKYDMKKTTPNLLYQNSLWGAAHVSSFIGFYLLTSKMYRTVGIDQAIVPVLTSVAITALGSWYLETKVREKGKSLVDTLESSENFRATCEITQRAWDFTCSGAQYFGIGLLTAAAFPIQSAIASYLKTASDTTQATVKSYPVQALIKTSTVIAGLFSMTFKGLYINAEHLGDRLKSNYTNYVHPYVSESYNFTKTAMFYSKIKDLCTNGTNEVKDALAKDNAAQKAYEETYNTYAEQAKNPELDEATTKAAKAWLENHSADYEKQYAIFAQQAENNELDKEIADKAKAWLEKYPKSYEALHQSYTDKAANESLSKDERREALKWLKKHPQDLTQRCPHAENITTKVGYVKYLTGVAAAVWKWSTLKNSCPSKNPSDIDADFWDTLSDDAKDELVDSLGKYEDLSVEDKDLCPYIRDVSPWMKPISKTFEQAGKIFGRGFEIASDPTTQKVALLALAAGVSLYWIHAFGTKSLNFLSRKEEKDSPLVDDADSLKEEEKADEHPEPSAPLPPEEVVEKAKEEEIIAPTDAPTIVPEEPPAIKPLAARTWTTKLSNALRWIAEKIQGVWTNFSTGCSYYFTKTTTYCDDLFEKLKRQMASLRRTPRKVE